jgi:glycosyltransferase involved in cell wall biosynthesis
MHKICHIIYEHPPFDPRVFFKEALSLKNAGFEVIMLVPSRDGKTLGRKRDVQIDAEPFYKEGIRFEYYKYNKKIPKNFGLRYANTKKQIIKKMIEIDAEVYHFHEHFISMEAAVEFKKRFPQKKMVFDFHEFFYARYREKPKKGKEFMKYVQMERFVLNNFDLVVTVDDAITNFFKKLGVNNIITVMNAQSKYLYTSNQSLEKYDDETLWVCHEGRLLYDRGLKEIIEVARHVKSKNVKFLIIGRIFANEQVYFNEKLKEYNIEDKFHITKWLPYEKVGEFLDKSHIGLSFILSRNGHFGMPNKVFNYLRFGLPIIALDHQITNDMIDDTGLGYYYGITDIEAIAQRIDKLEANREQLKKLAESSEKAFEGKYNWEFEADKLIRAYQKLL